MERKIYQLTSGDLKKVLVADQSDYQVKLAEFDAEKARLGRRFGLAKRQRASELLRRTAAYYQGKGQGALDLASSLPYQADTNQSEEFGNAYNLGYYTGYESRSNLRDLIDHNPNFAHLRREG